MWEQTHQYFSCMRVNNWTKILFLKALEVFIEIPKEMEILIKSERVFLRPEDSNFIFHLTEHSL